MRKSANGESVKIPTHLDLFSGIGGFSIAAEWAGFRTVAFSEIDPDASKVLKYWWPDVPNLGDIRGITRRSIVGHVALITGGVPCGPASLLGKRRGTLDERWMWPEAIRIMREFRPDFGEFENPPAILSLEWGRAWNGIVSELVALGYDLWWDVLPAAAVGAGHLRERIILVCANTHSERCKSKRLLRAPQRQTNLEAGWENQAGDSPIANTNGVGFQDDPLRRQGSESMPVGCRESVHAADSNFARLERHAGHDNGNGGGGRVRNDQLPRRLFNSILPRPTGGRLNPRFGLWLMGFPINWLKPLYDASETPSSRKSRTSRSKKSGA